MQRSLTANTNIKPLIIILVLGKFSKFIQITSLTCISNCNHWSCVAPLLSCIRCYLGLHSCHCNQYCMCIASLSFHSNIVWVWASYVILCMWIFSQMTYFFKSFMHNLFRFSFSWLNLSANCVFCLGGIFSSCFFNICFFIIWFCFYCCYSDSIFLSQGLIDQAGLYNWTTNNHLGFLIFLTFPS